MIWGEIMSISVVMNGIISLFLIMFLGVYGSRKKIITKEVSKGLTNIMLKMTLPLMIISTFTFTFNDDMKMNVVKCFIYSLLVIVISIVISYIILLPIKDKRKKMILQFSNVFSNCGYIGFPIINSIYGNEGVTYTSIFNMFFTIFLWTYGVILFSGNISKKDIKKVLLNPCVVAVYIGILLMVFNIKLPQVIISTMKTVGEMTSPLSMIIVGTILSNVKIGKYLKDWTIYYEVIVRLIIIPIIIYFIGYLIKDLGIVTNVMIVLCAMPAAAMTSILAENFEVEKEYASIIVFITTFCSIITLPLMLKILI